MKRTSPAGFFTIAASTTPQPLWGTAIAAAVKPSTSPVKIQVATSKIFNVGDCVLLLDNSGSSLVQEVVYVIAIPDSTHVTVNATGQVNSGVEYAYSTGGFVILNVNINNLYVQAQAGNNAAGLYLGTSPNMSSSTGAYCYAFLYGQVSGQPVDQLAQETVGQNPGAIGQWWIEGTIGDKVLATLGID